MLPRVVLRKKLFKKLERRGHYSATWVSGMAGSGKTTLVASYLAQQEIPCLWYNLDEGDDDPSTFFYYLGLAAQRVGAGMRSVLPPLTPEYLQNVKAFSRRFFEVLCLNLKSPIFLVFDDYQKISSSTLHESFQDGISRIPPGIHAIIVSRTEPPPAFARMLANNLMRCIGPRDLRLSLSESRRITEMTSGKRLPKTIVETIYAKTQGWAAGLILMAKHIGGNEESPEELNSFTPEEVFSYFVGELFTGMEEPMKDFLLKTSFLPRMTPSMAGTLTGSADASHILKSLEREYLFIERFHSRTPVYQFHPLFHEFLFSRAKETLSREVIRGLRLKATEILVASNSYDEAVDLLSAAGETSGLVSLIEHQAGGLVSQGRNRTLQQWIAKIPEDRIHENPWMHYWLGVSCQHASPSEARDHFENAFRIFDTANERSGLYLSWAGIVGSILYEWGYFTALDPWIEWLESDLREGNTCPTPEIEARVAVSMMCALMFRKPHHPDMIQWVERALLLSLKYGDQNLRIEAADWAITYFSWAGNFNRAKIIKAAAEKLMKAHRAHPPGILHWKWLDISTRLFYEIPGDSALGEVLEALQIVEKTGLKMWEHMFLLNGVFISLILGDLSKAGEFLKRLEPILSPSRYHGHGIFHHCAALYNLLTGDLNQALEHARTAVKISKETGYVFPTIVCRYCLAQILIEKEEFVRAGEEIEVALSESLETHSAILEFMCLMGKALLALNQEEEEGSRHLQAAMRFGRNYGFQSMIWWWHPKSMSRLCTKALSEGIEVDYCRNLIRAHDLAPEDSSKDPDNWPWVVKIRTLSRFEIIINEKPIRFSAKGHRRPLELLKSLIARGGVEVDTEKIMDDLWPEAEGDMAHSAFSTNLNRLRLILDKKESIRHFDGRLTLNRKYCWLDTWALEARLEEAMVKWDKKDREGATAAYQKALSIYKGHFLADDPLQHWMVPLRERLALRYLHTLLGLGKIWEEEGGFEKAIELYEKGLTTDNLEETFYQRLMICHEKLGRYADAVKVYLLCQENFHRLLNVSISRETEKIYERLADSAKRVI